MYRTYVAGWVNILKIKCWKNWENLRSDCLHLKKYIGKMLKYKEISP
jgi:hypothetical protein